MSYNSASVKGMSQTLVVVVAAAAAAAAAVVVVVVVVVSAVNVRGVYIRLVTI